MNALDWKIYESITKYIYETLGKEFGVTIEGYGQDCKVIGKSGNAHQIDVLTSQTNGIHSSRTAIECKHQKKKINKDVVMKLLSIINDTGIEKGIIVSKSGFTRDALNFAKQYNIGLVELREIEEKDFDKSPKQIEIADIRLNIQIVTKRPEILNIDIGNDRNIKVKDEFHYHNFAIINKDGSFSLLIDYINNFRKEINLQNKMLEKIIKHYKTPEATLFNKATKESLKIDGISFTGQLNEITSNRNLNFTLVDEVWLIMKSIFENRTFSFSENGAIKENKK
ncbi:restriction endonuclease [Flavobacterium sp. CYK-55]|uniref:restriction endonuclease n=1 Tax=Flavobacterium sp. CYK-55 TaxID=2835529 RepID=UPI001BCD0C0D|nr:restriction endonuclease [Flavobacterium sp. CYK-55]MBS7788055.1 restriction endonuclease [Flavobacterium sp. CYK-55]